MILCDIGNSAVKFYNDGKLTIMSISKFRNFIPKEKIYFINVNQSLKNKLKSNELFCDIGPYLKIDTIYHGIGIDRVAACMSVSDGIVIDAGTAITVDIMSKNTHLGGFILPGINTYLKAYEDISPALRIPFNSQVSLDCLPQKTSEAVSYGIINSVILSIKNISNNGKLYFTGGDGYFFSKFFENSIYDKILIFRSMLKVMKEKGIIDDNYSSSKR